MGAKWIVTGEDNNGKIKLVSQSGITGILPKGSYLTVDPIQSGGPKHILRVDESHQVEPYAPTSLVADLNLDGFIADSSCKNEVTAYRIKDISDRDDGLIDFIKPQSYARRSSQEEVDLALGNDEKGPKVFVATVQSNQNHILKDDSGTHITATIPEDVFFHQMIICGKTGSGKTVSMKYLSQYFVEEMRGAVLAINVKDVDFLQMDHPSNVSSPEILSEWKTLGNTPHGVDNLVIYMPANRRFSQIKGINHDICKKVTLNIKTIQPEAMIGLLQGISDKGALNLPSIFRYWRKHRAQKSTFNEFIQYFSLMGEEKGFSTLNERDDEGYVKLHAQTYDNILRSLNSSSDFFDNEGSITLDYSDILEAGKMSILDFSGDRGPRFGAILLRDLLNKIVNAKDQLLSSIPVLIIIDEVHQFYSADSTKEALSDLDNICRTGRSKKIGVIFASQSINDIPSGLTSVVNTQILFKTDSQSLKLTGVKVTPEEIEGLKKGFAVASINERQQLKVLKFPLSYCGVVRNE